MRAQGAGILPLFVVLNFCFAALAFLGVLVFGLALLVGLFDSGDTGEELIAGVAGCLVLMGMFLVGALLYLMAAIGLLRKSVWGYYCHLVGAVFAAFSCLGLVYTIPAFLCAFQPSFQEDFFPSRRRDFVPVDEEY